MLLCSLGLVGCAGISSVSFPDVPTQVSVGTIRGSNFGGHAPLVGAHVYLLQASATAYNGLATSLLGATSTQAAYPTTENISDPSIPTSTPWYYVTTDSTGAFNISGDYRCSSGYPVYLYAYGGTPTALTVANNFAVSSFNVISAATTGSTLKFTVATESFSTGDQIILSGFGSTYSYLNGQSAEVIATGLTGTTFELSGLTGAGSLTVGNTYTATGTATQNTSFNPGVVNLAMLGVCPSTGNFSSGGTLFNGSAFTALNYVYVNEVSTVATAYAMAGFGIDGLHIGTDTSTPATLTIPGINGIENAAMNAGNLYDIQGKYLTTGTPVGEGHIANPTTFAGSQNGTVPQAELDTLGNILAACVDSGNTYNPITATGVKSVTCTGTTASTSSPSLFLNASSNGGNTGGTAALNTAQAAFNIAHYPMTANVVALYTLPSAFPFSPKLSAAPNDFTVGIIYSSTANGTSGASGTSTLAAPVGVAIDSYGDAYVPNTTGVTKLAPLGNSLATTSTTLTGLDSIAIDQLGNVWGTTVGNVGSQGGTGSLYEFTSSLASASGSPLISGSLYAPSAIAIDSSNNIFMTEYNSANGGAAVLAYVSHSNYTSATQLGGNACFNQATSVVVGTADYAWVASSQNNNLCRVNSSTTFGFNGTGGNSQNFNFSLDSSNSGWFGNHGQTNVYKTTSGGTTTAMGKSTIQNQTNNNIAGLYQPTWSAVDGAGNIFFQNDNSTNSSISEISNAGVALSCPTCLTQNSTPYYGYQPGNVGALGSRLSGAEYPGGIAMDPSGDLWVANYSLNSVLEIIGVGTPLVTPLSSEKPGVAP